MRILSISGENIASLAQPFTIDFTAAPLAGAGLFAITGETGAGKSSILDAMCLALYGAAPRLVGAAVDDVPDPSGKAIKAHDPRAILRRGARQGWAEVRFQARDGQDYIARWHARRAHDRIDGQLQNVARSLTRASDGQVIASQISAVAQEVAALTGLSYEEFRRTVLLAQGDFDAFLRADTNERAALLEKVTGTAQYRAVSSRIYERCEAAQSAYDKLNQRRDSHQLLSAEAIEALTTEREALKQANQAATVEIANLQAALARHKRHTETAQQVAAATAELEKAVDAQTAASAARVELTRLDRAAPLRAPWQAVSTAHNRVQSARTAADTAKSVAGEAAQKADELKIIFNGAEASSKARDEEFKNFGPLWIDAADLDSKIGSAAKELDSAHAEHRTSQQKAKEADDALLALQKENAKVQSDFDAAVSALSGLSADCALTDAWTHIRQRIAEHSDASTSFARAKADLAKHEAEAGRLKEKLALLTTETTTDKANEAKLTEQIDALAEHISSLEAKHPLTQGSALQTLATALADMLRAAAQYRSAHEALAAAEASSQAASDAIAQAVTDAKSAGDALVLAEAQVKALAAPSEQADLAVSDIARELRLRLEPGAPCPVCGSPEHPVHDADVALAELAAKLRMDLQAARTAVEDARKQQSDAHRTQDRAQAQRNQSVVDAQKAEKQIADASTQWRDARNRAVAIPQCPPLPDQPSEDTAHLDTLRADAIAAQQTEAQAQQHLTELRNKTKQLSSQREDLRKAMQDREVNREQLKTDLATTDNSLTLAQSNGELASQQAERLATELAPLLQSLDERLDDPALSTALERRVQHVTDLRQKREAAKTALDNLVPRISKAESAAENAIKLAADLETVAATRQHTLQALRDKRAPLLGGEPTEAHRNRHAEMLSAATAALNAARTTLNEAINISTAATSSAQAAEAEHNKALQEHAQARSTLAAALSATDLAEENLAALFARPATEIESLRQQLRTLDDAVTSAQGTLASRRRDFAEAEAAGLPELTVEALAEARGELEQACNARTERIGAIDGDILRDTNARAALAGLEQEISKAQAELKVWEAVNHAAGSKSGDKFARIAQSITLDVLVDHANHHLADLNPRYRLRRAADLALQVEDRDMGNETRATRSLSGGERFLASLALALALSRMGGKGGLAATLFIDEGFGSLDALSLDLAIDALESLQSQGRQVGVISHVDAMKERIATRITVRKQGGGKSVVDISQGST